MGDLFNVVVAAEGEIDDLNQRLYDQANAAGANNIALAALGVELGLFTQAEAEAAIKTAALYAAIDILGQKVATGELTISGAIDAFELLKSGMAGNAEEAITLTKEMGLAEQQIDDMHEALDGLAGVYDVDVNVDTAAAMAKIARLNAELDKLGAAGHIPGEGRGAGPATQPKPKPRPDIPQLQHGGSFTVPAGFPNDSFPIRVQSGEHVTVTPAGRSGGGAATIIINNYIQGGGNPYFIGQEVAGAVANELGNNTRG